MSRDDDVRKQIAEVGFAYLGVANDALLNAARAKIGELAGPGENLDNHHQGFVSLAADTGFYLQAERLIGDLCPLHSGAQVTRRSVGNGGVPHLDGFYPQDQTRADTPDAILGVYLSNVPSMGHGAFTVWAGDRHRVSAWARRFPEGPCKNERMPTVATDPLPVCGPAGTAFLVHGAVLHCQSKRTIADGHRDAVFFRFTRKGPRRNLVQLLQSGGENWDY